MVSIRTDYISVGGNRHPSAADWHAESGLVAYGADNNVALWRPAEPNNRGVYAVLKGHSDVVNAVKFYTSPNGNAKRPLLITGSMDCTIRIWKPNESNPLEFEPAAILTGHEKSINCLAVTRNYDILVSGAADGMVKVWRIFEEEDGTIQAPCQQTITAKIRFFPLTLALRALGPKTINGPLLLAMGGTRSTVQIYATNDMRNGVNFERKATLTGHEGWIRSLDFTNIELPDTQDFLLASASQDKYIRLWRVCPGDPLSPMPRDPEDALLGGSDDMLTNKTHSFKVAGTSYSITFEALLFGHEDWVYSLAWNRDPSKLQLLSSSADNSLVIWESDPVSGAWYSGSRMGEISAQKGSTTATGSAGGFWIALWSPDGNTVITLGRTGSWRSWNYDAGADMWVQALGITGHVRTVNGIAWEPSGGYLLSTSADQTTRLHATWKQEGRHSWHEFARPQIHGYDLNCIASLGPARFVSGADEKLLRVFDETKSIAQLLERLSGFAISTQDNLPEAANIPVLGLSNKAVDEADAEDETNGADEKMGEPAPQVVNLDLNHPPLEDHLAKNTLWPEHEKLYGHGYEISAVAVSHDRSLIATACKATSVDHAVIRLFDAETWREIRPPLSAHSLTVTSLQFSPDDQFLSSVGRDRQWAVFERDGTDKALYRHLASNLRPHSRMILSAGWVPDPTLKAFATAGRDRSVKLWVKGDTEFECKLTISAISSVTAIDFLPSVVNDKIYLAIGEDSGEIAVHDITVNGFEHGQRVAIPTSECPSKGITQLSWRPVSTLSRHTPGYQLAAASEDSTMRIYTIDGIPN